jgi:hypothetical protein
MTSVLAVLVLTTGFSVAVETKGGYVERAFPNTVLGAEQFWDFAEPLLKENGNKVKVCTVTLAEDGGAIMTWLLQEEFGPALLSRHAYQEYARQSNLVVESPTTVAKACLARFPFIRRAK